VPQQHKSAKSKLPQTVPSPLRSTNKQAPSSKPQAVREESVSIARALKPGLYLVATPIGNLGDMSDRGVRILADCDVVACENRDMTARLFQHYGIGTPRISYNEHSGPGTRMAILARLREGQRVAMVSDAGTPLVSDPGYKLVREAIQEGHYVSAAPGPSAPLMALILSGLPSDRFFFQGFPPPRSAARRGLLGEIAGLNATLIFLESPRRLPQCLNDMAEVLGDRPAAVARELTKLHEEVRRDGLRALRDHYAGAGPPKGEVVVVVAPPQPETEGAEAGQDRLDSHLQQALEQFSLKEAVARVAADCGLPRKQVYARALALTRRTRNTL
jgi:16S rRNA (cytidine1402-2'-O)-methyltransferase